MQQVVPVVMLLGLWAAISKVGPWPALLFPSPFAVLKSFISMAADGRLVAGALKSLSRLFQGYFISVCVGLPLGVLIARMPWLNRGLKPLISGLQALPSICWLPLAILWFGLSESAIIFVVVMGSLLSVTIATEDGIRGIPPQLLAVSGTLGIRGLRLYAGVLIPAALPGIITGLKLGWSFAWRALMAGELLFVAGGLGQLLTTGRELLDVPQVMAVMGAIILIGVATDRLLFQTVEARVRRRWGLVAPT